jgi:hypothetical protein
VRRTSVLVAIAVALAGPVASARADGDPASDVLLSQDTFLPYAPNTVSRPMRRALEATVARAKAKGFATKVAVIASSRDLGSVGTLVGDPQGYADLLTKELSLTVFHGQAVDSARVLVVLPSGLGGNNLGDRAGDALGGLPPVTDGSPDGLARTAAVAVGKLAAADGKPFALPALPSAAAASGGGGGVPAAVIFGAPVLLVALVAAGLSARGRRREKPGAAEDDRAPGAADVPRPVPGADVHPS